MRYSPVLKLVATLLVVVAARQIHACGCTEEEIILSVRAADRIFAGQIVEAEVLDSTPRTIRFIVQVSDRLRGDTGERTTLQTAMPGDCGALVRPGADNLYVLTRGDDTVDACTALAPWGDDTRRMVSAIAVVGSAHDARAFRALNNQSWGNYTEVELDEILALAQRMDSSVQPVLRDERGRRYGNVHFTVSDGMVQQMDIVE